MTAVWKSSDGGAGLGMGTNSFVSRQTVQLEALRWHCRLFEPLQSCAWMQRFAALQQWPLWSLWLPWTPHWPGVKWDQMPNWTPELNTFSSGRPVQFSAHVTMICGKKTCLTHWEPKGYRNYNQGEFSQIELMHSWLKGSSTPYHFQADLCSRNRVTTTKKLLVMEIAEAVKTSTKKKKTRSSFIALLDFNVVHKSKLASCWSMHECHTCTHRLKLPWVRCQSTAAPSLQVKSHTWQGHMTQPLAFLPVL